MEARTMRRTMRRLGEVTLSDPARRPGPPSRRGAAAPGRNRMRAWLAPPRTWTSVSHRRSGGTRCRGRSRRKMSRCAWRRSHGGRARGWSCWTTPRSRAARCSAAPARARRRGIHRASPPPDRPPLNRLDPILGVVKHRALPERTDPTGPALTEAIHRAFTRCDQRLLDTTQHQLRSAA